MDKAQELQIKHRLTAPLAEVFDDLVSRQRRLEEHEISRMRDCACGTASPCSRCAAGAKLIGPPLAARAVKKKRQDEEMRRRSRRERRTA